MEKILALKSKWNKVALIQNISKALDPSGSFFPSAKILRVITALFKIFKNHSVISLYFSYDEFSVYFKKYVSLMLYRKVVFIRKYYLKNLLKYLRITYWIKEKKTLF